MRCLTWVTVIAVPLLLCSCDGKKVDGGGQAEAGKEGQPKITGWLNWRGPRQTGASQETGLPVQCDAGKELWSYPLSGRGTPVLAGKNVYVWGYQGEGAGLQEVLLCLDAESGKLDWERRYSDFLSDNIYDRYAIGSPAVDPESGDVYLITSPGLFECLSPDGKTVRFQHSLMETLGRLTFPNGRGGTVVIDHDLVIFHYIMSNWGAQGPAMDRFYACDKKTGELVWHGATGERPKDNSITVPFIENRYGKRVFYAGTGDGSIACFNARTGQMLWRYKLGQGGINSSVVVSGNTLLAIHNTENVDSSERGRMIALKIPESVPAQPVLDKSCELWRNPLAAFSSSPVLVGETVYVTCESGELCALDVKTGHHKWRQKLGVEQLHASPLYADGRLYVPIFIPLQDENLPIKGKNFFVVQPEDGKILGATRLEGDCIGAPSAWNGRVFVHTTKKLYCFGKAGSNTGAPDWPAAEPLPVAGEAKELQIIPSEVLLRPGGKAAFRMRSIDQHGLPVGEVKTATWESYIPPTALVKALMKGKFNATGELVADAVLEPSAGAFKATAGNLSGIVRGRVLPDLPLKEDFNAYTLAEEHKVEAGVKFAYPPLSWIGARFKWEIREVGGEKCLTKTIDNTLFQRAMTFFGHPDTKGYTIAADVMSDGNKRKMSEVGVINQRYNVILKGNAQQLEVNSNQERLRVTVPFKWVPMKWYTLKARVDVAQDGSGTVRAKAWPKGEAEPLEWTLEVPLAHAHTNGSPGLFGFSPQLMPVYVDNVQVTPNGK